MYRVSASYVRHGTICRSSKASRDGINEGHLCIHVSTFCEKLCPGIYRREGIWYYKLSTICYTMSNASWVRMSMR